MKLAHKHNWSICLGWIVLGVCLLSACGSGFTDISSDMQRNIHPLDTPTGSYFGVAWIQPNLISFIYSDQPTEPKALWDYDIRLFQLGIDGWNRLEIPRPAECRLPRTYMHQRLPNNSLGFIYECFIDREHVTDQRRTLQMWEPQSQSLQVLHQFPDNWFPSQYAFSPNMSEWIQEQTLGSGINDLYRVKQEGPMERILPDFARASSPAWSNDGRQIAFFGNEAYPGKKPGELRNLSEIRDFIMAPWDLYLMDADGDNLRKVLSGVGGSTIKWLPQGDFISFIGEYGGRVGIWVLNLKTEKMTLVWPYSADYDWSPDGKQMIVIEKKDAGKVTHPAIVDVPQDIFKTESQ